MKDNEGKTWLERIWKREKRGDFELHLLTPHKEQILQELENCGIMEQDFILRHEEGKFFLLVREGKSDDQMEEKMA